MPPKEVAALAGADWRIEMKKDVRIPAFVSLLKAAHLTLFHMLGYRCALSAGGYFLGRTILGDFFLANRGRPKTEVVANARPYFREFAHMLRPVQGARATFKGTADDRILLLCEKGTIRWGLVVLVRTSPDSVASVLVPLLDSPVAARVFLNFLQGSSDEEITTRLSWFRGDCWQSAMETTTHLWPKTGILYPDDPTADEVVG